MSHKKKLSLALQGGGSHGAFTWGILERLLEENIFDIRGICGTSAGAMNAAMVVYGLHKNGNHGAIEMLNKFWLKIADSSKYTPFQSTWLDNVLSPGDLSYSIGFQWFNFFTNTFSPYQFNLLDVNPLKKLIEELIDFEELNKSEVKLFSCATNVKKGKPKVFKSPNITADMLMASACLPMLYKAVEIDGEFYWDGGYMGNPPIYPLIDYTDSNDILLIKVNPLEIREVPKTVKEIQDRINDISFNSSLSSEMRMIHFKDRMLNIGYDLKGKLRKIYFHEISADDELHEYSLSSKFNISREFLLQLKYKGRRAAEVWMRENLDKLHKESSLNIRKVFL
ncbi:MAG: patatin-like phospholipase family protein [Bacteroidota bacterium]|jgi:NTE family protein